MDSIVLIVIIIALVLVLAVAGIMLARRRRSEKLQEHFGTEYERTVTETGDRKAAETQLTDRERRHRELDIRSLRPEERDDFSKQWESVQQDFVDDPSGALNRADALVVAIMRTRGYPVDDFDRRADDISVAHPDVVHHYREARSVHDADGTVDTEQQRHAVTSYRSLVKALLGDTGESDSGQHAETHRDRSDRHDDDDRNDGADRNTHDDHRMNGTEGHVDETTDRPASTRRADTARQTEEQTR